MLIQKVKVVAVILLATALAAGGVFAYRAAQGTEPVSARAAAVTNPPPPAPPDRVVLLAPAPRDKVRMAWVEKQTFGHKAAVTAVAFGRGRVAAGDKAGCLFLWDAKAGGKELLVNTSTLAGARGKPVPISFAQFSPDGKAVYFALADGTTIQQCSLDKGGKNRVFPGDVRPDGARAKTPTVDSAIPGAFPGDVRLGAVSAHGLTPDGKYWLQSVALFDRDRYQLLLVPNLLPKFDEQLVGEPVATFRHAGLVAHAAPASGEAVVSVSSAGILRRWEKGKDEPAWEVKLRDVASLDATGVLVSPGGTLVAVTGDAGQVWTFDAKSGKLFARAEQADRAGARGRVQPRRDANRRRLRGQDGPRLRRPDGQGTGGAQGPRRGRHRSRVRPRRHDRHRQRRQDREGVGVQEVISAMLIQRRRVCSRESRVVLATGGIPSPAGSRRN